MDRLEAMHAFVTTVDRGSFSAAARALGRSVAAISRAVMSLEDRLGAPLLRRTTRSLKLTDEGERYLGVCRRVLIELAEAERRTDETLAEPRGVLTVTAPAMFGALYVRPVLDTFLRAHPSVRARLLLLDRVVDVVGEGVDVALRIAHLPDSALVATSVGLVHRLVCASPAYLKERGRPRSPSDLARHRLVAFTALVPGDTWTFRPGPKGGRARALKLESTLTVNTAEAAIASAIDGVGITCVLSYQARGAIRDGALVPVLASFAPAPVPIQLVYPRGSTASAKVRTFVELAVPTLRASLAPEPQARAAKPRSDDHGRPPRRGALTRAGGA